MIDWIAGTTRKAATSSVKISWPVKIRRSRMVSSGRRDGAAAERAGERQDGPGDDPEPDRQRGRGGEIRRERERGAERAHRGGKGDRAGGHKRRSQRRQHHVALHRPWAGTERARG